MTDSQDAFADLLATLREVGERFAGEEWGLTDPTDVAEGLRVDPPPPGHRHRDPVRGRRRPPGVPGRSCRRGARRSATTPTPATTTPRSTRPGTYRVRGNTGGAVYVSFTVEAGRRGRRLPVRHRRRAQRHRLRRRRRRRVRDHGRRPGAGAGLAAAGPRRLADHRPPLLGGPDLAAGAADGRPRAHDRPRRRRRRRARGPARADRRLGGRRHPPHGHLRPHPHARDHGQARRGRAAGVRVPRAARLPAAGAPGRPRPGRRRRRLQHGAVPARARRRAGHAGALARVPVRQRVAVEPPAPDVRLPARTP